ncbi:MAG: NYN domain-containing protein [Acetivibrionales bacterium]|jgi:ribosomal protection tetracycline resistance protein|nr:GTP-binding protein [Clostridiaceae bacterium]
MNKVVIGILAHVDAGKTTLSEGLLYVSGNIRKLGRVDNKDAYLDNYDLERARGITIFSKQAILKDNEIQITLLDTPGHVDFSSEMERTLQVLDYAILIINGADGVQGHTKTLWRLLSIYNIPVFIFVNKMDMLTANKGKLIRDIKKQLSDRCIDFSQGINEEVNDQLAMTDEALMETFLEKGGITSGQIKDAVKSSKVFPCYFGSALKLEGISELLEGIKKYTIHPAYPDEFGARIFKIGRDEQGNRLTYMKVTGGNLKARALLTNGVWEEKVNQIRIYSGEKYEAVNECEAGEICAVTGLNQTRPGEGLGFEKASPLPLIEPVMTYQILLPDGMDPRAMLPKLRELEEENPELSIVWSEVLREIQVKVMGQVQIEILQSLIQSRFGVEVAFGPGKIVYKETIANTVEGVGHFEPLRHYAEVHLLLEPAERGSGISFYDNCSEDTLGKSWKNLIMSHLKEKEHKGVLTGSSITDINITLVSGKAHNKHTEGGDFREATYRAVRQGLKEAESVLLEPCYSFHLELPEKMLGRAMNDIENMRGTSQILSTDGETAILTGSAPVVYLRDYQNDVNAYTRGQGKLFLSMKGYEPCHNADEVIEQSGYDSERDVENPTGSVFCSGGTGFIVPWYEVKNHMHLESYLKQKDNYSDEIALVKAQTTNERWLEPEEVDRILNKTFFANQGKKSVWKKRKSAKDSFYRSQSLRGDTSDDLAATVTAVEKKDEYLLVDGYNVIFAWPELKELAEESMDASRNSLLDSLSKYQSLQKCNIIVVFDAYRVQRHREEIIKYHNINVVYTKEAQTADLYIEKFAYDNKKRYDITVATSDALEQIIIRGTGSAVISARELKLEIERVNESINQTLQEKQTKSRNFLGESISANTKKQIEDFYS